MWHFVYPQIKESLKFSSTDDVLDDAMDFIDTFSREDTSDFIMYWWTDMVFHQYEKEVFERFDEFTKFNWMPKDIFAYGLTKLKDTMVEVVIMDITYHITKSDIEEWLQTVEWTPGATV